MDKQQIAHILEKEIAMIDINIKRLHRVYMQEIDSHQQRFIYDSIQDLTRSKKELEKVIENIVEDARNYSPLIRSWYMDKNEVRHKLIRWNLCIRHGYKTISKYSSLYGFGY